VFKRKLIRKNSPTTRVRNKKNYANPWWEPFRPTNYMKSKSFVNHSGETPIEGGRLVVFVFRAWTA